MKLLLVGNVVGSQVQNGVFWSMQPLLQFIMLAILVLGVSCLMRQSRLWADSKPSGPFSREAGMLLFVILSVIYYEWFSMHDTSIGITWALPAISWMMGIGMLTYWAAVRGPTYWLIVACIHGCHS